MERSAACALLSRYVREPGLTRHCLATGAVMKALAVHLGSDPETWETIGILHDIDFELIGGDMEQHGIKGEMILLAEGIDPTIASVVKRHNHHLFAGTYTEPVDIALQAADSASGLITACALVKGGRLSDVTVKTVTKKAKEKSFAAGCDRTRIAPIESLLPIPEFYATALGGLLEIRGELDLS
ncbi:HDIG domain-containing metalloprotein [Methanoregula sp. UBA64]|jgi:putative nucleotidyltransferase with HDIG domain|uniref:HDIG domain-containing metalloprotein n=1 Tax=Methanoregula sp. UBA64 TaxID=1915554 RepID=UPI0025E52E74|nr:HDIG domain-containing metalloprotein [Methanoregula sp. UBA64]